MNDRIKELAEEAMRSSMVHDGVYRPEGYAISLNKAVADKFAELIIREFAYDCMNVTSMPDHINHVAKRWGVEL
jgi:predicted metal-dependent phosphoesterase TrpH